MSQHQFTFDTTVESVIDGDTLHVALTHAVPPPFDLTLVIHRKLRLSGVNSPELSTVGGFPARDYTRQWLLDHVPPYTTTIHGSGLDKYGNRIDGRLSAADGHVLNDDLLAANQAVAMKD